MSAIPGTNVGAPVVPYYTTDANPSHVDVWGQGVAKSVSSIAERNAIASTRLKTIGGDLVFVTAPTNITYRLKAGWPLSPPSPGDSTTNSDWEVAVGAGGGISGTGLANAIGIWQSSGTMGYDPDFGRDPATEISYNNAGYSVEYGVDTIRYISPTGSDSADGLTAGTAWQTPGHAVFQRPINGRGKYQIICAAGTYSLAGIAIPTGFGMYDSPQYGNSLIEFVGDTVTPTNVVFDNNGTIIYHNAPGVSVRFSGITFTGSGANVCIQQSAGVIYIHSCVFDNFDQLAEISYPSSVLQLEIGSTILITNTNTGFVAQAGAVIVSSADVTMTLPMGGTGLFRAYTGSLVAMIGSNVYSVRGNTSGFTFQGDLGIWQMGYGNQFDIDSIAGLMFLDNKSFCTNNGGCSVNIINCIEFFDVRGESFFKDTSDTVWTVGVAPSGVVLGSGGHVDSKALVNGVTPLIDYITYFTDTTARYSLDARYTDKPAFTAIGVLPGGYIANYLSWRGVTSAEVPIYRCKGAAILSGISVYTRVGNGASHTDIYEVYINGAPAPTPFGVSITNGNSAIDFNGTNILAAEDRLSIVFTSDAATLAEDITVELTVNILE